jgi:hypothetical protein
MQFKSELIKQILARRKIETRRPVKPGDSVAYLASNGKHYPRLASELSPEINIRRVYRGRRLLWEIGRTYAICPGRGKPQVARFRLLDIRREDVRDISEADVIREGFAHKYEFLWVWCDFYDPSMVERILNCEYVPELVDHCPVFLRQRPDELYDAWALTFELSEMK